MFGYDTRVHLVQGCQGSAMAHRLVDLPPEAKVRRLNTETCAVSSLEPGCQAIRVQDDSSIFEPDSSFYAFERNGTSATLAAAEAWKVSSKLFKTALLQELRKGTSEEKVATIQFLDQLVAAWKASRSSVASAEQEVAGDASASNTASSSSSMQLPNLERESFDFSAAALRCYAHEPTIFGWIADAQHATAVERLSKPFRLAFESEIPGPWAEHGQDDWMEEQQPAASSMPTPQFNQLLDECYAALILREHRNHGGGHPFDGPDAAIRENIFKLYEEAVAGNHALLRGFPQLAAVSVKHVREKLDRMATESAAAMRVVLLPRVL